VTVEEGLAKRLLAALPDIPRWVETRSPLLHRDCELMGLSEKPLTFVVVDKGGAIATVVGTPPAEAIWEAVKVMGPEGHLLGQNDNREHIESALPGWQGETAILHLLADESALQKAAGDRGNPDPIVQAMHGEGPDPSVKVITNVVLAQMQELPDALRAELNRALLRWLVVAAYTPSDEPASLCYAGAPTESLWSIAIETLEPYRRRGYATQAVRYLVDLMWERRKRPIWAALESNTASLALAKKLGFRQVDTLVLMHAPDAA
jgi:RimJ/RimL family protein N-acetyltransferase